MYYRVFGDVFSAVTHWMARSLDDSGVRRPERTDFCTAQQVAASWTAKEPSGAEVEFDNFFGRPCVLFFSGMGAYHCVNNLAKKCKS